MSGRLAVLGHPVAHSRSPAMHTAALEEMGMGDWAYEAIDVEADGLAARLSELAAAGFVGVNVTVPHKAAALALANDASPAATEIAAANTLTFRDSGIRADNTDAPGLLAALPASPGGKRALVLGAGGAARAAVWALAGQGARVEVWNRTGPRAVELAEQFGVAAIASKGPLPVAGFDLLLNSTAVGMGGGGSLADLRIEPGDLGPAHLVVDLAYGNQETSLVATARDHGCTVVDGIEVLVRQGAESLRIWTGREPPVEVMRRAARC